MIRVRFVAAPGQDLRVSVERLRDGQWWDFLPEAQQFSTHPGQPTAPIKDGPAPWSGLYRLDVAIGADRAPDGNYCVYVHDPAGAVIGAAQVALHGGDDEPPPASTRPPVRFPEARP